MSKTIGIDLGTTNSAVAIIEGGQPKIVENAEGNRTTPSIVAISKNDERLVGQLAKRQSVTNPQNTVFGVKRYIGHDFADKAVQKDLEQLPYKVEKGEAGGVQITMGNKQYRPEEISAMVLGKIKADVEAKLGEEVTEAVITVPAYFNDDQRKATMDAGKIAGLEVKRIINEPTAAALAYGFDKKKEEKIVVYDFGGGTFDISVLEVGDDVIEVKATGGDSHMGGEDIDQAIIRHIGAEFKKESGIDITKDVLALQRLKEGAEKAKHELSTTTETEVNIPFITSTDEGPQHLLVKIKRSKLEELAGEYIDRSIEITKQVLKDSGFSAGDIDEVILVGGQTRMPKIAEEVEKVFNKAPNKTINPDEVVALGAAVQAGVLQGDVKDVLLLDVIPLSLGIETMGGVMTHLIEKNTTLPTSHAQVFSTAADNQPSVEIHVLQGERSMAQDNKDLGRFILDGIAPAPRGVPQVEVTFDVNANGILNVSAKDKATGKENSIKIEGSSGLTEEEIEKMKADAEKHADEDKEKKELVDMKNNLDATIFTAEKSLKDYGDKVSDEVKKDVEEKVESAKKVKDSDNLEELKKAHEEVSVAMQKIGEEMAKAGEAPEEAKNDDVNPAGDKVEDHEGNEDNVTDAETEESDDTEK